MFFTAASHVKASTAMDDTDLLQTEPRKVSVHKAPQSKSSLGKVIFQSSFFLASFYYFLSHFSRSTK
jgi:hypothetical protein